MCLSSYHVFQALSIFLGRLLLVALMGRILCHPTWLRCVVNLFPSFKVVLNMCGKTPATRYCAAGQDLYFDWLVCLLEKVVRSPFASETCSSIVGRVVETRTEVVRVI